MSYICSLSFLSYIRLEQTGMLRKGYFGTLGNWWDPWTSLWECRNGGKGQMWLWLWCGLTPPMSSLPPTISWSTPVLNSHTTGLRWTCPCGPACGPYVCCITGVPWQRHAFSSLPLPTTNTCLFAKVRVTLYTLIHKVRAFLLLGRRYFEIINRTAFDGIYVA